MSDRLTARPTIQDLANAELDEMKRKSYGARPDPQPCAGCAALREALTAMRDFCDLLAVDKVEDAGAEAIEAIAQINAALAQSQPDGTPGGGHE